MHNSTKCLQSFSPHCTGLSIYQHTLLIPHVLPGWYVPRYALRLASGLLTHILLDIEVHLCISRFREQLPLLIDCWAERMNAVEVRATPVHDSVGLFLNLCHCIYEVLKGDVM